MLARCLFLQQRHARTAPGPCGGARSASDLLCAPLCRWMSYAVAVGQSLSDATPTPKALPGGSDLLTRRKGEQPLSTTLPGRDRGAMPGIAQAFRCARSACGHRVIPSQPAFFPLSFLVLSLIS